MKYNTKITLAAGEIRGMEREIEQLTEENRQLKYKLDELNKENIRENAVDMAQKLFVIYMSDVCRKLGFEFEVHGSHCRVYDYEKAFRYGTNHEEWLQVTPSIKFTNDMKTFILYMYEKQVQEIKGIDIFDQ